MNSNLPKALIPINGKPLIHHVMEMWRCEPEDCVFILGHKAGEVMKAIPDGATCAFQDFPHGIADAILQAEGLVDGRFVVALGDCIQRGRWIVPQEVPMMGVGVWETDNHDAIKSSYSVKLKDGRVSKVVEKPKRCINDLCGMGTYFLNSRVFEYIRQTPVSPLRGEVEITDTLQLMIDQGEVLTPVFFCGDYLNVTYPEDMKLAEQILSKPL